MLKTSVTSFHTSYVSPDGVWVEFPDLSPEQREQLRVAHMDNVEILVAFGEDEPMFEGHD